VWFNVLADAAYWSASARATYIEQIAWCLAQPPLLLRTTGAHGQASPIARQQFLFRSLSFGLSVASTTKSIQQQHLLPDGTVASAEGSHFWRRASDATGLAFASTSSLTNEWLAVIA
jgi:hypothetical protein